VLYCCALKLFKWSRKTDASVESLYHIKTIVLGSRIGGILDERSCVMLERKTVPLADGAGVTTILIL
jgi:hypothetical protein